MIAFIEGTVIEVGRDRLVLQTGGFGVELFAPPRLLAKCAVGAHLRIATQLIIREDAWTLYGFPDVESRTLFTQLLSVSGVGPKVALALLSTLTPQQIALAVATGDAGLLASAPGVGKRTAERLVVELKGKIAEELEIGGTAPSASAPALHDAIEALIALGYREASVRSAVGELFSSDPNASAETLIRKALARLR